MRLLCVLVSVASVASLQTIPPTMTAAYKAGILPCKAPFSCVKTHSIRTPSPGEGQVLIAVAASSVNPCDVDYLEYGVGCSGGGGTLGMDMAGTVIAVGSGCKRLRVGDRVWADTGFVPSSTSALGVCLLNMLLSIPLGLSSRFPSHELTSHLTHPLPFLILRAPQGTS